MFSSACPVAMVVSMEGRSVSQSVIPTGNAGVCPAFIQMFLALGATGVPPRSVPVPVPPRGQCQVLYHRCRCTGEHTAPVRGGVQVPRVAAPSSAGSVPCPTGTGSRSTAAEIKINAVKPQHTQGVHSLCPSSGLEPSADLPGMGRTRGSLSVCFRHRQLRLRPSSTSDSLRSCPGLISACSAHTGAAPELPRAPFSLLCSHQGCSRGTGSRGCSVRAAGAGLGVPVWGP